MGESNFEEAKGQPKEALGDLTDDDKLQREGRADQVSGAAKNRLAKVVDMFKKPFRRSR